MTVAISRNKRWNFIRFILPVTLPATLPGTSMRDVALAFAGLRKEGFIHFDNAGQSIRVGVCTGMQKAMTPPESRL